MEQAVTIDQVGGPFGESAILTTETNMSSYGIPILLWRGEQLSCAEAESRGIYPYALMPEPIVDSTEGRAAITAWMRGIAYTDELIAEEKTIIEGRT